jgi:UDP-N-acetylglucosamine--N-acetylmuramyl-(pentapeptide) pyrophosphoryl-undecaprenol N-acetylglucosamine transferase
LKTIAFTGGGTGGHIYPGLAVATSLPDYRVLWIGSAAGMDKDIVQGVGISFFGIPAGKLRRYFSLQNIADAFKIIAGFFSARKILKQEKPAMLFSKGGFVSVPPVLAAASLNIPICTHESDYSPGLATKINIRFAGTVFTAYPDTARFLPEKIRARIIVSGNPVRASFYRAVPEQGRAFLGLPAHERILLVLGGSQGAQEINELIRDTLPALTATYTVVHQTGATWKASSAPRYLPIQYIHDEMPHILATAEVVVGRSGAGTVWECATIGVPMILIPLRGSGTRGDQVENAHFFSQAGAAIVLPESTPAALQQAINTIAGDSIKRNAMAAASKRIGSTNGACIIARTITDLCELAKSTG